MHRIVFVCHGNICRSTMAEYVMRHLVRERGLEHEFVIDSAAATRDALGLPVHHRTRAVLERHGIACGDHRARALTRADYDRYDLIVGMDRENWHDMRHILRCDPQKRIHLLLDWTDPSARRGRPLVYRRLRHHVRRRHGGLHGPAQPAG